jgi:putative hydrolase of the HAD superfamily
LSSSWITQRISPAEIRGVLDAIEEANARIHGYGTLNFARNLRHTYERLAEREVRPEDLETVMGFAERILECPMETIAGVPETLAYLAARHDLTLFTKGHPDEQTLKIDRSGLGGTFSTPRSSRKRTPAHTAGWWLSAAWIRRAPG